MSHAGSEAGLRGIRRGPSAWLVRRGCSGAGSAFAPLRGPVRLVLLGLWSSSWSLLGSQLGAAPWPHLGRRFFGEATHHREGSAPCLTSTCSGGRGDPPELGKDRGSQWLEPARPRWCPVRPARRPHEMERSKIGPGLQLICPSELKSVLKASATISWVCVWVCVSVGSPNK